MWMQNYYKIMIQTFNVWRQTESNPRQWHWTLPRNPPRRTNSAYPGADGSHPQEQPKHFQFHAKIWNLIENNLDNLLHLRSFIISVPSPQDKQEDGQRDGFFKGASIHPSKLGIQLPSSKKPYHLQALQFFLSHSRKPDGTWLQPSIQIIRGHNISNIRRIPIHSAKCCSSYPTCPDNLETKSEKNG